MSTKRLTTRLRDPKEWDVVLPDVPIFVEHSMYELPNGESIALLPGKSPPAGATLKYQVDEARLVAISNQINEDLERHDCPIKLRDGHTKHGAEQKDQPPVVGYGAKTKVTTWNGSKAITTPLHYERGYGHLAQERPERSPEYRFRKNSIPDVALLATEPRLKMGMTHRYAAPDDIIRYAMGMESMGDEVRDPTDPTVVEPALTGGLSPEEQQVADKIFDYLCSSKPQMGWMCSQFKDAQAGPNMDTLPPAPGQASPPLPSGGVPPGGVLPPGDSQPYSEGDMNQQEADALRAELADVKAKLAKEEDDKKAALSKYAETDANRHIDSLVIRYEFPAGAKEKVFSKMCATDDNGRKEIAREIETCWKPKAGTSSIAGAGQIPVDTTPETDQYADTEPPIALMHQIASEKGLSFSGPQYQEIRSLAKQHMKAAR